MTSRIEHRHASAPKKIERVDNNGHVVDGRVRIVSAESRSGVLQFVLRRVAGGLYVEREERPHRGTHTSISVEFADRGAFERWCNGDPCRFDSPLLYQRLRRDADELWGPSS